MDLVTERRRAEELLREREARYHSIFDATGDGLVISELDTGVPVAVNPAFCRMHGYTCEELIGLPPTAFVHPNSLDRLAAYLDAVQTGGRYQTQAADVRKDGTLVPVEVHGSTFTYRGKPHVLGVVRDITERVHVYELLEQRVEERTRELATPLDISHDVAGTLELRPLRWFVPRSPRTTVDARAGGAPDRHAGDRERTRSGESDAGLDPGPG